MERKLNLGCGLDIRPTKEGWINMDMVALPGVDVVHDLLDFPWPLADQELSHVFMSHILEHVPHHLGTGQSKDGFLLVMEEIHRVLRPGGTVEILGPHHESTERWADPTHTRVLHPGNFSYLEPGGPFSYYTSAAFHTRSYAVDLRSIIAPGFLPLGKSRLGIFDHIAQRVPFLKPMLLRRPWTIRVLLERA